MEKKIFFISYVLGTHVISTNADNLFKNGKWHLLLQLETEQSYTNKPRA